MDLLAPRRPPSPAPSRSGRRSRPGRAAVVAACGLAAALALLAARPAAAPGPIEPIELIEPIEGLDPVLLSRGREVQGEDAFTAERGPYRYFFASAATRDEFLRDPERYEIQLGGVCARMGQAIPGNPDLWAVHEGRLYLFGAERCRELFLAAPGRYLPPPPGAPAAASAAETARGRELLAAAVAAAGGAARLGGLTRLRVEGSTPVWWGDGEGVVGVADSFDFTGDFTGDFAGRVRLERRMPFGTFSQLVTPEAAVSVSEQGAKPLLPGQRQEVLDRAATTPIAWLRARHREGFAAAARGRAEVGGRPLERLEVAADGRVAELGIDPESGRILAQWSRERGPEGEWGEVVELYSDFREVGGLVLPFRIEARWEGEPFIQRSLAVAAVAVDDAVDPAVFVPPAPAGEAGR